METVKCSYCGEDNFAGDSYCSNCKARIKELPKLNGNRSHTQVSNNSYYEESYGEGYIKAGRIIAWTEIVCSVIAAIIQWSQASSIRYVDGIGSIRTSLGFYFLIGGVIIFVLLMLVCHMAENIVYIRRNISRKYNSEDK